MFFKTATKADKHCCDADKASSSFCLKIIGKDAILVASFICILHIFHVIISVILSVLSVGISMMLHTDYRLTA